MIGSDAELIRRFRIRGTNPVKRLAPMTPIRALALAAMFAVTAYALTFVVRP